jgi:5'-3' exonuclease
MKLLAVDGNNLLMRALHATRRSGMSAHGVPTGPLHVFVNTLAKHIREEEPTHIGIAWDGGGQGLRAGIDEGYKANRAAAPDLDHELKESSFALAREFCDLAGIHQQEYPGEGVEADDIIGAWWRYWTYETWGHMVILSSDKDLLQFVEGPRAEQIRLSSADTPTDRWNEARVLEHYGVPPRTIPELLAIAGDVSDNIIGVRGIGPKKAAKALQADGLDFGKCIRRWPDDAERLRQNLRLTDLRSKWPHVIRVVAPRPPVETTLTTPQTSRWQALAAFLDRYELKGVKDRLEAGTLWSGTPVKPTVGRRLKFH